MKASQFLRKLAGEGMWSRCYIITVLLVSAGVLIIGAVLWSSGAPREIHDVPCPGWCRGAEHPAVYIDSYIDFQCWSCIEKEKLIKQALYIYPDQVRHFYHHYPASEYSHKLSEAMEAAGEQGMFWEFYDAFLAELPEGMDEVLDMAQGIGLDTERFADSLDSGKFADIVAADKAHGISVGVSMVGVFINGKEWRSSSYNLQELCDIIDQELERIGADDES